MVVLVKLKKCRKATRIHSVLSCWKEANDMLILTVGDITIVYDADDIESLEII